MTWPSIPLWVQHSLIFGTAGVFAFGFKFRERGRGIKDGMPGAMTVPLGSDFGAGTA